MKTTDRTLNKTERLFALVLLLQTRPNLSSLDLAKHFHVSRRTIFRDLRALAESGVPLTYADGGGYEILEGYQLPPLMFSAREAATLLMGTEFAKLQSDPSLREDADSVGLKIRAVLPEQIRTYIDRLQESTVIAPYTQLQDLPPAEEEEGHWYELSEAVANRQTIFMRYWVQSREELTARKADPLGLVYYSDHWNLIAHDHLRGEIRNFRLDQIVSMKRLDDRFEPPASFNLRDHLRSRGDSADNVAVRIRVTERVHRWARRSLPADIDSEEILDGGDAEISFQFGNMDYLARWILRYGTDAEVLEPTALRERIRERASALADHYA